MTYISDDENLVKSNDDDDGDDDDGDDDEDDDDDSDSVYDDENLVKSDDQPSPSHSARTSPRDISQLTKHTALLDKYTNQGCAGRPFFLRGGAGQG